VYDIWDSKRKDVNIGIYDILNHKLTTLYKSRTIYDDSDLPILRHHSLCESDSNIFFSPRFSTNIYRISKTDYSLYEAIQLTGISAPTKEFLIKVKSNNKLLSEENNFILDVSSIFETTNYLMLSYQTVDHWKILISKKTGQSKKFRFLKDKNYLGNNLFYGVADNAFISYIRPSVVQKDFWGGKLNESTIDSNIKEQLLRLNLDSNPILVLTKFSDF
jgi:hypothetical protein